MWSAGAGPIRRGVLTIVIDERATIATIPNSLVRLRIKPGRHRLSVKWHDQGVSTTIEGQAGTVLFLEVVGAQWAWNTDAR
jgi:hypothetical protein